MSYKRFDVMGIGSPIVDLLAMVADKFIDELEGEKGGMELVDNSVIRSLLEKIEEPPVRKLGGAAANTIFALTRLGQSTSFLGMVGTDEDGKFYQNQFAEIGGDCSRFKFTDEAPTARCVSLVTPDSERTLRTHLGAASRLNPGVISVDDFSDARHLHMEGYLLFNRDLAVDVLQKAKKSGCTISFDLGSFEMVKAANDILPELLEKYIDIVFANEEEAAAYDGNSDYLKALEVMGKSCDIVALKLGQNGALIRKDNEIHEIDAILVEKPIDTTGAGDYWAAGFLFGYLNDCSLEECGKMGAILGGEVVKHIGTSLPEKTWKIIKHQFNSKEEQLWIQ